MSALKNFIVDYSPLSYWVVAFLLVWFAFAVYSGFFKARKIQPNGFNWKTFRNEFIFALINLAIGATALTFLTTTLTDRGVIAFDSSKASWWVVLLEYALYFFLFDTWFYWFHRAMHKGVFYTWIHKLHHRSTAPNLLTTLSVHPLESLVNGGFMVVFTSLFTVHSESMAWIGPTNIIMGLYVHSGYEFLPRWWNKTWLTKWFISTTFHDQHHKYFNWNFGGYTTVWDHICGTTRAKYEEDFIKIKDRAKLARVSAPSGGAAASASIQQGSQGG